MRVCLCCSLKTSSFIRMKLLPVIRLGVIQNLRIHCKWSWFSMLLYGRVKLTSLVLVGHTDTDSSCHWPLFLTWRINRTSESNDVVITPGFSLTLLLKLGIKTWNRPSWISNSFLPTFFIHLIIYLFTRLFVCFSFRRSQVCLVRYPSMTYLPSWLYLHFIFLRCVLWMLFGFLLS